MKDFNLNKIIKAINYAAIAHEGQVRKTTGIPKITHLFGTAVILMEYNYNEDIVIAGLLHDIIEDCPKYKLNDIKKEFGTKIANYVKDESESDKSLPWKDRKDIQINKIKNAIYESKVICAADKIHNLTTLINDQKIIGDKIYKSFNASKEQIIWYYNNISKSIVCGYEKQNIPIFIHLNKLIKELNKK